MWGTEAPGLGVQGHWAGVEVSKDESKQDEQLKMGWTSLLWVSFWAVLGIYALTFVYIWERVHAAPPWNGRQEEMGKRQVHL